MHQSNQVTYKEYYFPLSLRWVLGIAGFLLLGYLIYQASSMIIISLTAICLFGIQTSYYETSVDLNKNVIVDSFNIFMFSMQKTTHQFENLHKIRLDKQLVFYNATHRARDRNVEYFQYIGYLNFDTKSIEICRSSNYETIKTSLTKLASKLGIDYERVF